MPKGLEIISLRIHQKYGVGVETKNTGPGDLDAGVLL